jgi:hypothetical protein
MADDDLETADDALDPAVEPKSAKAWLSLITVAEKAFDTWQGKSDNLDKLYANLERLANINRDREFQLFWANVQVLGPSIYSRPPVPVVTPRFKDRRPIPRMASEMLERASVVNFEEESIDEVMRLVRDDMTTVARGAVWVRYEAEVKDGVLEQEACIEHVNRKDFLHDPARNWKEVDWVAKRSWLTRKQARKRFYKTSANAYQDAAYEVRKDGVTDDTDGKLKAGFWELWSKSGNKVVWISEGVEVLLDEGKPHLDLEGFFPCPRPAYGTTQRNSLVPVPDMLFYKDQLEEINEITGRIAALSESLRLRGFYPAGAGEIGDAIEAAIKSVSNNQILVPISNWAALGGANAKDMILWLPLDMVATTIQQLIELRKQLIDDVYQITGLSDIMRGSTVASETLGAQELKSQYGSIRIRDRQDELIRLARDITRIAAEIMAENFSAKTLLAMSQLEIATDAQVAAQIAPLEAQGKALVAELKQAATDPEVQQMAQQQPDKAKQVMEQAQQQLQQLQGQIAKLKETVTIEQVMKFLRDNRVRCFTLDIETDSTIAPDENAQKQRATEYVTAMTGLLQQVIPAVQQVPQVAPLAADIIRFVNSQFRVGRQFEQTVEEFTDQMKQMASAPKNEGPTPEQVKAQADAQKGQLDAAKAQGEAQKAKADALLAGKQLELDQAVAKAKAENDAQKVELDRYKADLAALTAIQTAKIGAQQANQSDVISAALEGEIVQGDRQHEIMRAEQDHAHALEQQAAQQAHDAQTQAVDQQHQQGMQESAQDAAAEQAAQKEPA